MTTNLKHRGMFIVKAVGDMAINPESRLGYELIKIMLLEKASPDQLGSAIRELDEYTSASIVTYWFYQ